MFLFLYKSIESLLICALNHYLTIKSIHEAKSSSFRQKNFLKYGCTFSESIFPSKNFSLATPLLQNELHTWIFFVYLLFYNIVILIFRYQFINTRTPQIKTGFISENTLFQFLFYCIFKIVILLLFYQLHFLLFEEGLSIYTLFELKIFWCLFR